MMSQENQLRYAVSFSGGKDSVLALDRVLRSGLRVERLVTLYDEASERVRFHGVPVVVMRTWYEERVRAARLKHVEPLWGEPPGALGE